MLLCMITIVNGYNDIDVNCDSPDWYNTDICRDFELQDEFDTVVDYINDLARRMQISDRQLRWMIHRYSDRLWRFIKENIDDWDNDKLWDYIKQNEELWSKDEATVINTGSSMSDEKIAELMTGNKDYFDNHNDLREMYLQIEEFYKYYDELKALITEQEIWQVKTDRLGYEYTEGKCTYTPSNMWNDYTASRVCWE